MAHNKTLAAQLYGEFKEFFPNNAVEYFVSYYDYYQPEAYVPSSDTFIEKDAQVNDHIEQMRCLPPRPCWSRGLPCCRHGLCHLRSGRPRVLLQDGDASVPGEIIDQRGILRQWPNCSTPETISISAVAPTVYGVM